MATQLKKLCRNNKSWIPSWNWAGYPIGVPHLLVYCRSKAICVVILQPKCPSLERGDEPFVEGYYATMYGCSCERVLALEQLVVFFKNKRPPDSPMTI